MSRTIVVKVGTSTLADAEGRIDRTFVAQLAAQLCDLRDAGHRPVLVSSGAVRAGVESLGWSQRPRTLRLKQAAAAVGQGRLMALYADAFAERCQVVAQVLLTRQLAQERVRYVNAQNTLLTLLRHGVTPIINENDTVAVEELQFGDNDTLAALVAALVGADTLILLTNVPGLLDDSGEVIPRVEELSASLRGLAKGAGTHGSGGMVTKLQAAEIAGAAGVHTIIAPGRRPGVIPEVVGGAPLGTWFVPPERRLQGRKHWLAYGMRPTGSLTVNECARVVLVREGRSLLAAGVVGVDGPFAAGDAVSLRAEDGHEFARGQVTCDWREAERVMGRHSDEVKTLLGRNGVVEIVHRDNLVVLATEPDAKENSVPVA